MESIFNSTVGVNDETGNEPDPILVAQVKSGGSWFYWIAGLSVVNSLIFAFGGAVAFIAGLGFTQLIDTIVEVSIHNGAPSGLKAVAIGLDLIFVIIFALFGYYANKWFSWAFIIGIGIYGVDILLLLLINSWLAAGFHVFALFFIVRGFLACRKLKAAAVMSKPSTVQTVSV